MTMRALAALAFVLISAAAADADSFLITASGTWNGLAPTSPESAPGSSWSFSLDVTAPLSFDNTAAFSSFSFALDGTPVSTGASFLEFFDKASLGLFDLGLADGDFLTLSGAQVFDAAGELIPGSYAARISIFATSSPIGRGRGTVVINDPPGAVPEPASIVGLATGLVALAGFRRSWRRDRAG
jgi:hypothetical protein